MTKAGIIFVGFLAVLTMNLAFAGLCEPRSVWLMRDKLGVNVGKDCRP